jgi:tetratricopeptide (TPR) repeat protein
MRGADQCRIDPRTVGRYQDANTPLVEALAIARDIGYRVGEADALQGLGIVAGRLGHGAQAISQLESAVAIGREIGETVIETGALNDLGEALFHVGHREQARARHGEALRLAVASGDRYEQGRAHAGLARLDASAGELSAAATQWHRALPHFIELGMPEAGEVAQRLAEIA